MTKIILQIDYLPIISQRQLLHPFMIISLQPLQSYLQLVL